MAYIKVKKNSNLATDPKMLARILKNNPKLRGRVGTVLRPGDVIKVDQKDIGIAGRGRGTTQRGKTPPPIPSKGNTPHKKAPTKPKPASQKVVIKPRTKPKSTKRSIVVKPLTQPVSVTRQQPQQQVARRVTTQSPGMMGPSGVGSTQTRPTIRTMGPSGVGQAQTLPRAAARFDIAAQAGNAFNQQQSSMAKQGAMVKTPTQQTSPLGGGGYTFGKPVPPKRLAAKNLFKAGKTPLPPTVLPMPVLQPVPDTELPYVLTNTGERIPYSDLTLWYFENGMRPLIVLPYWQNMMGLSDLEMEQDLGYQKDEWGNWIRLGDSASPGQAASGGGQQLYQSGGYGGGYGGGGWGNGGGGGGYGGYAEQERNAAETRWRA